MACASANVPRTSSGAESEFEHKEGHLTITQDERQFLDIVSQGRDTTSSFSKTLVPLGEANNGCCPCW